jgi:hypothetical protein
MWINKFGIRAINQKSPNDITEGILYVQYPPKVWEQAREPYEKVDFHSAPKN